jgi:hypothetical protein
MLVLNMVLAVVFSVYDGLSAANDNLDDMWSESTTLLSEMLPCFSVKHGDGRADADGDGRADADLEQPFSGAALDAALEMEPGG